MTGQKQQRKSLSDITAEVLKGVSDAPQDEQAGSEGTGEHRTVMGRLLQTRNESIEAENVRLAEENERFKEGEIAVRLDPKRIRLSPFIERSKKAFSVEDEDFAAFVDEIRETDGNTQPGVVRPVVDDPDHDYEVAAGQRRHAGCLVADKPFLTFIRNLTDRELLREKRSENAGRLDVSPYEHGIFWRKLLNDKTYSSIRDLEEGEKVPRSTVHRYLKYADIPEVVVNAFADPRTILQDWVEPLLLAHQQNADRVTQIAQELAEKPPGNPITCFNRLVGKVTESRVIGNRRGKVLVHTRRVNGCQAYVLKKDAPPELIEAIDKFLGEWAQQHAEEIDLNS